MKKNVIVSLADSNYFPLLNELIDSIKRFKGLEKPIILLVNLEENLNDETKMRDIYSGLSRARGHLIIISNQNSINFLKELYAA